MKKLSKKIIAIALASVMAVQVGAGFAPTAKSVKAEDAAEPNYLDVSYDFTKMTDDELNSSALIATKYNTSRSGSPNTRWRDGNDVQAGELWNISNNRLLPAGTQHVRLHVAEEKDVFQLKFEATAGTAYGYGIDIGTTDITGYGSTNDNAVFGFVVDTARNIETHGFAAGNIKYNDKIASVSGNTIKAANDIPKDVVTKWTVIKSGKNVMVSEEVTGIEFSFTLASEHETGMISLRAVGSGRLFSKVSVDYMEAYYDFTKMTDEELDNSALTATKYNTSRSGSPNTRWRDGNDVQAGELWNISNNRLLPAGAYYTRLHVAEECDAYQIKFEATKGTGYGYGIDIGTTDITGYGSTNDNYVFGFVVDTARNIETHGFAAGSVEYNDKIASVSGNTIKAASDIPTNVVTKWTVSVDGTKVVVSEEVTGILFSITLASEHRTGMISLKAVGSGRLFSKTSVDYPLEEVDPEGTYTFTKMNAEKLQKSGIKASQYRAAGPSGDEISRPVVSDPAQQTADNFWEVSKEKGLTPKVTDERQLYRAHLGEETESFELKFEAYGYKYGFSIGTPDFMGNNNAAPLDAYTVDVWVSGNNIYINGLNENTIAVTNGTIFTNDGGGVKATNTISTAYAKWTVKVLGMDVTVSEETSGVSFTARMLEGHIKGVVSLRAHEDSAADFAATTTKPGFYKACLTYEEVDENLIIFDGLDLTTLEGWKSRIYNTGTKEATVATDITEQWFTGMDYSNKVPEWNNVFNQRNNPGLKPRILTDEATPYILSSAKDYENFESYITYYQNSVRYAMVVGDKEVYPTTIADSAAFVYIHGSTSSGYELRVSGAIDCDSAVLIGESGTLLRSSDSVRLPLNELGFAPDAASSYKTTTIHVKVQDGVLTAWADDLTVKLQVNLAPTYKHGGVSLLATGSAHGGFKYFYVNELEDTVAPATGTTAYTMSSKDEYAVIAVNKEVPYSYLKADVNFDDEKYDYVKAVFGDKNYRINGSGNKELVVTDGKVSIDAYTNTADSYVNLYFKTKDGSMATDFTGFSVNEEKMFVAGGKEIANVSSTIALEQDYKIDSQLNIVDLVCARKDVSSEAAKETREVLVGKDTVSPLFGKSALFLGDSIMNAACDNVGWYGRLASYGMDVKEVAQDGWALTSKAGRNRIISQFQYADSDKAYDYVVLEGGVNDVLIMESDVEEAKNITWGTVNENGTYDNLTIAGAMQELITTTRTKYPNAKIVYVINSEFGSTADDKQDFVELVKDVCDVHGIDYVDLSDTDAYPELAIINDKTNDRFKDYMVDNIHPNAKSYDLTTPYVAAALIGAQSRVQGNAYVYVNAAVDGEGNGSAEKPFKTLATATNRVKNGGTIEIVGTYACTTDETTLGKANKEIILCGDTLNVSAFQELQLKGAVTLKDITLILPVDNNGDSNAKVFANGNPFVVEEGVQFKKANGDSAMISTLFGGATAGKTVESTYIKLMSGKYGTIYGGGTTTSTVSKDTYVYIGGTVNQDVEGFEKSHSHARTYQVFGGAIDGDVLGKSTVIIDGKDVVMGYVYGGGCTYSNVQAVVSQESNVTIKNGTIYSVFGGALNSKGTGRETYGANVKIEGGHIAQVFGGTENNFMTGTTNVHIIGGTITRRIYGGCYENYVESGTSTVIIDNVNFTATAPLLERNFAISSRSYGNTTGTGTLKISTQELYNELKTYIQNNTEVYVNEVKQP